MRIIAFAGPSLPQRDRDRFPQIVWRPPAEAGDLMRLQPSENLVVCLIDGYFDHRPAVRHKEILWLLSKGVRIFGASSIGALRAAEMAPFGMAGVGAIYSAYARGTLVGDDEVALVHGPAERDWMPLSVPLVDVRATLCAALRARAVNKEEARRYLRAAAEIHYVERDWDSISATAIARPHTPTFRDWLRSGNVAQKHLDALACIHAALSPTSNEPLRPQFVRTAFAVALARELEVAFADGT